VTGDAAPSVSEKIAASAVVVVLIGESATDRDDGGGHDLAQAGQQRL